MDKLVADGPSDEVAAGWEVPLGGPRWQLGYRVVTSLSDLLGAVGEPARVGPYKRPFNALGHYICVNRRQVQATAMQTQVQAPVKDGLRAAQQAFDCHLRS